MRRHFMHIYSLIPPKNPPRIFPFILFRPLLQVLENSLYKHMYLRLRTEFI